MDSLFRDSGVRHPAVRRIFEPRFDAGTERKVWRAKAEEKTAEGDRARQLTDPRTQSGMGAGLRFRCDFQRLRTTIIDHGRHYTRECPAIEVNLRISSREVTPSLESVIPERGARPRRAAITC